MGRTGKNSFDVLSFLINMIDEAKGVSFRFYALKGHFSKRTLKHRSDHNAKIRSLNATKFGCFENYKHI